MDKAEKITHQKELIEKYKSFLRQTNNAGEAYKWQAINNFQQNWNIESDAFEKMLKVSYKKTANLFYQNTWGFITKAANHFPKQTKKMFVELYNEEIPLNQRITLFQKAAEKLLPKLKIELGRDNLNHQQDERAISIYLAFKYPEKYYLFMDSFYQSYCKLISETPESPGKKLIHFNLLAENLKQEVVLKDKELIHLHKELNYLNTWNDSNLIVQNILFTMLSPKTESKNFILVNITWNSNDWKEPSHDKSGHKWVTKGGQPHESWNFDFENPRNNKDRIFGFCQFTNAPAVSGTENLIIFYSKNKIVGFYGRSEVLKTPVTVNENESYNLIGTSNLCIGLTQKIDNVKEKGYLGIKTRMGQTGFIYLHDLKLINQILDEAIRLNPDQDLKLNAIKKWVNEEHQDDGDSLPDKNSKSDNAMEDNYLNQILFGPPGTGKTYHTINEAIKILDPVFYDTNKNDRQKLKDRFEALRITNWDLPNGQIGFCTFHQSFSYEDFVEGIKPLKPKDGESIKYDIIEGLLKKLSGFDFAYSQYVKFLNKEIVNNPNNTAIKVREYQIVHASNEAFGYLQPDGSPIRISSVYVRQIFNDQMPDLKSITGADLLLILTNLQDLGNANRLADLYNLFIKYYLNDFKSVLIIDEINRGNISQIFGELITLIEDDKRLGKKESVAAVLPYSKQLFGIPPKLFIIGTMNTADRSIEALDTALRRRFTFHEIQSNPQLIAEVGKSGGTIEGIDLVKMLATINNRIEKLIDKDHQIGHSYLLEIVTFNELKDAFKNKIIPLLEEYFYCDFGKIGLVLGNDFVVEKEKKDFAFASFKGFDTDIISDLKERRVYLISDSGTWLTESFRRIYE